MTGKATPPGMPLRSGSGLEYRFDPGALSFELLVTGGPDGMARWEVLHAPEDLRRWAGQCRLAPTPALELGPADVRAARTVRDALWRIGLARVAGRAPAPADLAALNAAAAVPPLIPRLAPDTTTAGWAEPATGAHLLSTVARDAIAVLTGPHADRLRICAGENCSLLYVDTSRPGRRRWCAMENCGNRHKVRAHRARRAPEAT
ncbi:CGNR zinc finger domain-containing protein [Streptomyces harbinensis]|uniref:CGNR zinc finger domain-containing protein n=1 Tax=Streptomyces harbinensis TaxID=1176198 RepID=UPI0036B5A05B